ncbi:MAG: hypothetical protein JWM86_828 [Thermoleophilia bacterium]|nr:hypothetical protein [Thermoleophilia bacterium]
MSVRIRVYPQNGMLGMNGLNGGMGAVSASALYNTKLQSQKQISNLQLGYERALWSERLDKVRLEERLKNPYAAVGTGALGVGALGYGGLGGALPMGVGLPLGGGLPFGGMPMNAGMNLGGIPQGFGGSGQSNVTNQTSTGGSQSVTNSNSINVANSHQLQNPYGGGFPGYPQFGFGGGGLISGLLGALI